MAGQARTLDATAAAQVAALRSSLFAATTLLCREPALAGAGRCLKRGRGSTPTGVSSLRVPAGALSHALPLRRHAWHRKRCCSTAAEQPQASLGTTQSLCARQWAGAAPRCVPQRRLSTRHLEHRALRASAEIPISQHLGAGWMSCRATAAAQLRHCGGAAPRSVIPQRHLQQHSHRRARARSALGRCHRRQVCGGPPPVRGAAAGLAQAKGTCHAKQSHTSAAEEDRHHLADRGRHVDADALLGSTPSTSAQAPRRGFSPLPPPLLPPLP